MDTEQATIQLHNLMTSISSTTDYGERVQSENAMFNLLNGQNFLAISNSFLLGNFPLCKTRI